MENKASLSPAALWSYFEKISAIPRPSKKEEKIIRFLLDFGKEHGLETLKDEAGNVLIRKNATAGHSTKKTVALQAHVDMVCEKNSDVVHDFDTQGIETYVDGDWMRARGTTLGADNGIGMAAMLAILSSTEVEHGNLECLFTVDEETGLSGANALKKDFLKADILLNLDSEDEKEIFIGCAGGIDTTAVFDYTLENLPNAYHCLEVAVKGLRGGHSGGDIDKGFGNANKILTRFLWRLNKKMDLRLCQIDGGNLRNAIAREAFATFAVPFSEKEKARVELNLLIVELDVELAALEPALELTLKSANAQQHCIDKKTSDNLLNALCACPHGVIAMSHDIKGLVETSTNLASVKMRDNHKIEVCTSQRSSTESLKIDIMHTVESVFALAGATITHSDGYPGWKPNLGSAIVQTTENCYRKLFNAEPRVLAIHAGLECGLFLQKYPQLDMVSFGPTIQYPHSPNEQVNIPSVERFWQLLCEVLKA